MENFSFALEELKKGRCIERAGWNGKNMYIFAMYPDSNSFNTLPYIVMKTVQGDFVPWLASQTDIFAEDWVIGDKVKHLDWMKGK